MVDGSADPGGLVFIECLDQFPVWWMREGSNLRPLFPILLKSTILLQNRGSSINHKIKDFGFIGTYQDSPDLNSQWATEGSNLRPLSYQDSVLPLN